ncbi:hypothetical protein PUN28_003570 [Cardiocondyla obscurior]|uniref:Uncharacterized protein n=1 Tax=Cardiocondyla obscurior TaxID=286306 RepID=A0AAW2GNQ2_9HYME
MMLKARAPSLPRGIHDEHPSRLTLTERECNTVGIQWNSELKNAINLDRQ